MTADSDFDNSIVPLRILASTADRRRPMTTKEVAEKRLEVLTSGNETLINGWWFNYFDTPDAVGCFNNEIKIISNLLTCPTLDTKLGNSVLILTEEQFKQLKGKTFDKKEIDTNWLTKQQAKEHPVWQELLRESLDAYVDAVFKQYENRFGKANLILFPLQIHKMFLHCALVVSAGSTAGLTSTAFAASSGAAPALLEYSTNK